MLKTKSNKIILFVSSFLIFLFLSIYLVLHFNKQLFNSNEIRNASNCVALLIDIKNEDFTDKEEGDYSIEFVNERKANVYIRINSKNDAYNVEGYTNSKLVDSGKTTKYENGSCHYTFNFDCININKISFYNDGLIESVGVYYIL